MKQERIITYFKMCESQTNNCIGLPNPYMSGL